MVTVVSTLRVRRLESPFCFELRQQPTPDNQSAHNGERNALGTCMEDPSTSRISMHEENRRHKLRQKRESQVFIFKTKIKQSNNSNIKFSI
jgi:hypothetical protein